MNNSIIDFFFSCILLSVSLFYAALFSFEQKGGIPLAPPLDPPLTFQQGRGLK